MIANPNDGNSPRVEVATPTIDVSAEGLITATTEQEAGYVPGGSKSATQQLTTQAAKTVTPGTTTQTAVASGRYTTGDVDVAGDANLVPENIAEGVSIFGVTGTHSGGGTQLESISINFDTSDISQVSLHYYSINNGYTTTSGDVTDCLKDSIVFITHPYTYDCQISGDYEEYGYRYSGQETLICKGNLSIYYKSLGPD